MGWGKFIGTAGLFGTYDFEEVFCYILVENKEKGNNNLCWH